MNEPAVVDAEVMGLTRFVSSIGELSAQRQTAALVSKGEENIMPDFAKPGRQNMQEKIVSESPGQNMAAVLSRFSIAAKIYQGQGRRVSRACGPKPA